MPLDMSIGTSSWNAWAFCLVSAPFSCASHALRCIAAIVRRARDAIARLTAKQAANAVKKT